jgi:S1-C subfamily serine protease
MQGQVIGMNTAIISDIGTYSEVGFAIPADDIVHIIPKLIRNGNYTHTCPIVMVARQIKPTQENT